MITKIEVIVSLIGKDIAVSESTVLPETKPQYPVNQEINNSQGSDILMDTYTFQNFMVGPSNRFAYAAANLVSQIPGRKYNPLFICGGIGLGKSHLLCAIGHHLLSKKIMSKVIYISSERFTDEFVTAMRFNKMDEFKAKYRGADVLLIDDIQFIAGKERTQEEFFHIFNTLFESHKQIVMTSDRFPKDIENLDERLRSRFEWGLTVNIQPPDLELRLSILKKKAELNGLALPDDVAVFIAEHTNGSVGELEGNLTQVLAFALLTGQEITLNMAKEVLKT